MYTLMTVSLQPKASVGTTRPGWLGEWYQAQFSMPRSFQRMGVTLPLMSLCRVPLRVPRC